MYYCAIQKINFVIVIFLQCIIIIIIIIIIKIIIIIIIMIIIIICQIQSHMGHSSKIYCARPQVVL